MSLTLPIPISISVTNASVNAISDHDHLNYIVANDSNENDIKCVTNGLLALHMNNNQQLGINKYNPNRQLDINSPTGQCLQLTYRNSNYVTFDVDSNNNLSISASNSQIKLINNTSLNIGGNLYLSDDLVRCTAAQLNYNDVLPGTAVAGRTLVLDSNKDITGINNINANYLSGIIATSYQPNIRSVSNLNIIGPNGLKLAGDLVIASAAQINLLAQLTPGTATASNLLMTNNYNNIDGINDLSANFLYGTINTTYQPNITSVNQLNIIGPNGLSLNGNQVVASAQQINYLSIPQSGTVYASRALVADSFKNIIGLNYLEVNDLKVVGTLQYTNQVYSLGINTSSPDKQLEVNSATGNCLRLTNNDSNGNAQNYCDFIVSSDGNLSIIPSGGVVHIPGFTDDATPGIAVPLKPLVVDANKDIVGIRDLTVSNLTVLNALNSASSSDVLAVNTTDPANQAEINSSTGQCLRLSNNAPNGNATNYTDFSVDTSGNLTINPSGGATIFTGGISGTIIQGNQPNITSLDTVSIQNLNINDESVTSSATQLNYVDINQIGVGIASKAVVLDDNRDYSNINHLTVKSLTVLDGVNSDITILKVNTTNADRQAEINSDVGNCLRLSNNAPNGNATNYCDFIVSAMGDLSIIPSGGHINLSNISINNNQVSASADQINYNTISDIGIAEASKSLVLDENKDITGIHNMTLDNLTVLGHIYSSENTLALGVNTNNPAKQAEINSETGDCLRLSNNAPTGNANNYTDFTVSDTGDLTINASGGNIHMTSVLDCDAIDNTNDVLYPLDINRYTSATVEDGIGVGISYNLPNINSISKRYGSFHVLADDITVGSESGKFAWNLSRNGVDTQIMELDSLGRLHVDTFVETSDRRTKQNIIGSDKLNSINQLCKINIYDYTFKYDHTNRKHKGVMAQELREIIPEAVHVFKNNLYDDFHAVENKELISYMIQSIQYLKEENDQIKKNKFNYHYFAITFINIIYIYSMIIIYNNFSTLFTNM